MRALPNRETMSVEEYLQLDRASQDACYEYFNGRVISRNGDKERHNLISGNTSATLWNLLRGTGNHVYGSNMRVCLNKKRYVYPDVTVACNPQVSEEDILENPRVIVEVLSPSTEMVDRVKKLSVTKPAQAWKSTCWSARRIKKSSYTGEKRVFSGFTPNSVRTTKYI